MTILGRSYKGMLLPILVSALTLLAALSSSDASWTKVHQFTGMGRVSAAYFFDRNTGLVGLNGASGTAILRTTDGGTTWNNVICPPVSHSTFWLSSFYFRNASEGWASHFQDNSSKAIWHTLDGGRTWTELIDAPSATCVRVTSNALVVTQYATTTQGISVSTDGGNSFSSQQAGGHVGLDFTDDLHGVASGFLQGFYYTSDGGVTWQPSLGDIVNESWGVAGVKGTSTFIATPEGTPAGSMGSSVLRSLDNGRTWTNIASIPNTSGDVQAAAGAVYSQAAFLNGLYRSTDAGITWRNIGGPNQSLDGRFAITECGNVIYAFDANGGVYQSLDGGDGSMRFVCGHLRDTLAKISAALCDSVRARFFIHNPFSDTCSIVSLDIRDSVGAAIARSALTIDSLPLTAFRLLPSDSMGFILGWKPLRALDSTGADSAIVRVIYHVVSGNYYDTVYLPLRLEAGTTPAKYSASAGAIKFDSAFTCEARDTVLSYTNLGCISFWITKAALGQHKDWSLTDINGKPISLPIEVIPSDTVRLYLHFLTHSSKQSYDTLRVTIREIGRDSLLSVKLSARGSLTDALASERVMHFDSLPTCSSFDSIVTFNNSGCDTVVITLADLKSKDWSLIGYKGAPLVFPIRIAPGSHDTILVHFQPSSLGGHFSRITFHYKYLQFDTVHAIDLDGAGKPTGVLDYSKNLAIGTVSLCNSIAIDTFLTFSNSSCDSVLLDSALIGGDFLNLDSLRLPFWVRSGQTERLHVRFIPHLKGFSASKVFLKYFINDQIAYDSVSLSATVIGGEPVYHASLPKDSIVFENRTECDSRDSVSFTIANAGCDSMTVMDISLLQNADSVFEIHLSDSLPRSLINTGSDSIRITVGLKELLAGNNASAIRIRLRNSDGVVRDTTIPLAANITKGTRSLSFGSGSRDLGTITACTSFDTEIVYHNIGCLPVTISERSLTGTGFDLVKHGSDPRVLAPGEYDTLHITLGSQPYGAILGQLVIKANTDDPVAISYSVSASIKAPESMGFVVSATKDPVNAGEIFSVDVRPDRPLTGVDLRTIKGEIAWYRNAFQLLGATGDPNYGFKESLIASQAKTETHSFELSSSSEIPLDPSRPLITLRLRRMVADSVDAEIALRAIRLNDVDPKYEACVLSANAESTVSHLNPVCGDSLIIKDLQGVPLLTVEPAVPNPIGLNSRMNASIGIRSLRAQSVTITLEDMNARPISQQTVALGAGQHYTHSIDLAHVPSGVYYYTISSDVQPASVRGSIQLVK